MQFLSQIYALFWRTIFRPKKCGGVQKMTNMRYAVTDWNIPKFSLYGFTIKAHQWTLIWRFLPIIWFHTVMYAQIPRTYKEFTYYLSCRKGWWGGWSNCRWLLTDGGLETLAGTIHEQNTKKVLCMVMFLKQQLSLGGWMCRLKVSGYCLSSFPHLLTFWSRSKQFEAPNRMTKRNEILIE